jgi:acetyl esterase
MTSPTRLPGRLGNPNETLRTDPRSDPRLVAALERIGLADGGFVDVLGPDAKYEDVLAYFAEMEAGAGTYFAVLFENLPPVEGVRRRTETVRGIDGNEIRLYIHEPLSGTRPLPGVVHAHGGGMAVLSATDMVYVRWRDELAARGLVVVGVEFRNSAGKLGVHPFPAGLDDFAAGTRWAVANRRALGASAFIVSGESGGGNLCLATALKANREGWVGEIAGVYSCCPAVAGAYWPPPDELVSLRENEGYTATSKALQLVVRAYDPNGEHANDPLAWPYRATRDDLAGLPPHVISVNELDLLRDEGTLYAEKLRTAGVPTVSRIVERTSHGADCELAEAMPEVYAATLDHIAAFASARASELAADGPRISG